MVAGRKNGAGLARFTERFAKVNGVRLRYLGGQIVAGAGHWLIEEAPDVVIPAIRDFVD